METATALLGLAALGTVFWAISRHILSPRYPLPPGPPGKPFIGNLLDIPKGKNWLAYATWAETYGEGCDILSRSFFGQTIIVLNSPQDVQELFVTRATNYSERMRLTMADLTGWRESTATIPPGQTFRAMRRFMAQLLGQSAIKNWQPIQEAEIDTFIRQILTLPEDLLEKSTRLTSSIILKLVYGYSVTADDDPLVKQAENVLRIFHTIAAPGWMVDMFPILLHLPSWLPGMGFKRQAAEWRKLVEASRRNALDWTKGQIASGNYVECFAADLLADQDRMDDEPCFAMALSDLYIAGSDTTSVSIASFLILMALHPEVQLRAQREIDSVTHGGCLPGYADRGTLPYVLALIKEVHRWHPVGPMGIPHCAAAEDEYKGYTIPRGAIVFANVWSILHDPNKYPDPASFNPERYLVTSPSGVNGSTEINEDPTKYAFGFGTRQCPGRNLAQSTLFLTVVKILATCTISDAVDVCGLPVTPETVEYLPGITRRV
ncbi:cytochrome P450 [Auricularia subglabra TFB-10046 SS5]|nr:cytochrome P450 [Auricularia subglabra TFB-10046 SS5]